MYESLINDLRYCSDRDLSCSSCHRFKPECEQDLISEAADAIEFLQTYKVALENMISIGGWWLVGQDKNLYSMNVPMNWPPKGTKTVQLLTLTQPPKERDA